MPDHPCFKEENECPKCGTPGGSTDFAGGVIPDMEIIIRRCQSCGYTRIELPIDHEDCKGKE